MKKIYFPLLGAAALMASACEDRLDIEQKGVIALESFYKTDADAENAVNNLYQSFCLNIAGNEGIYVALPLLLNEPGDDMLAAGNMYGDNDFGGQLNEFRIDTQNEVIKNAYWGLYGVIYDCNTMTDRIEPDSQTKLRVLAEARTLRAWCHLMAAICWDRPPLVDHVLPGDAKPGNSASQAEVLEWVAKEAMECVANLDEAKDTKDDVARSKVTKGMALTVAGKAYLFLGKYAEAKAALKQVIDSRKYALVPTEKWANLFHASGDLCEEMIFQANAMNNTGMGDWDNKIQRTSWMWIQFWNWRTDKLGSQPAMQGAEGWGGHAIRGDFAEKMLANDGDSPRRKATFLTSDEFLYEMQWSNVAKDATLEEKQMSPNLGIKDKGGLYGFAGYFANKFIPWAEDNEMGWYGFKNLTIFRYAEVLLMYAEACAQTGDNDGLQYLQAIQNRAGSKHVSTALTLDEVKNEKAYEMWLEGCRFPDQVRWGDTQSLEKNGLAIPSSYDEYFTSDGKKPHKIYVKTAEYNDPNKVGFKKGQHEYFPFPFAATSINPNLKSYPNY